MIGSLCDFIFTFTSNRGCISPVLQDIDDKVLLASETFWLHLTGGFNIQHWVSYLCSIVTTSLKSTVFELEARDRQTERTDGRTAALLNAPTLVEGRNTYQVLTRCGCSAPSHLASTE